MDRNVPAPPGPIMWQRLNLPGHDVAIIERTEGGAVMSGKAVFLEGEPTALDYAVECTPGWHTREARVRGRRGMTPVDLRIARSSVGDWTLGGIPCPDLAGCVDLDLSFTPATNLIPVRRMQLQPGAGAEVRSAWLEWPTARLVPLVQRYRRRGPLEYEYEADLPHAPAFRCVLRVEPCGWVVDYPGLWRAC